MSRATKGDQPAAKIFIVDDHPVVRAGLAKLIEAEKGLIVSGEADNGSDALAEMELSPPDVLITDLSMQGMDGMEVVEKAVLRFPHTAVVVLSVHDECLYAERVLRAGAKGYVMKREAASQLVAAIRTVLAGESFLSKRLSVRLVGTFLGGKGGSSGGHPQERLSDRELQVFRMMGEGINVRGIAASLSLSVKTIETHVAHLKQKFNLGSLGELVQYAQAMSRQEQAGASPKIPRS